MLAKLVIALDVQLGSEWKSYESNAKRLSFHSLKRISKMKEYGVENQCGRRKKYKIS